VTDLQCRLLTLWTPTLGRILDERGNLVVMVGMKLPEGKQNYFICTKCIELTLDCFSLVQNSFQKENPG